MSKVTVKQQHYDSELESRNQRRSYRCDYVLADTGLVPIYREILLPDAAHDFDRTPWWKRSKPRRRKKS